MIPFSLVLEVLIVLVLAATVVLAFRIDRRDQLAGDRGWRFIEAGFLLLLFGALVDVSDHFEELSRFVILGRTPYQSFAEKVVGFLGGFAFLSFGLWLWLPHVVARRRAEEELRQAHAELEERVSQRTAELQQRSRELQGEVWQRERAEKELKAAIAVAEEASRAKSHFLANMSHELRSPLNSVIGFANILLKNREGNLQAQQLRYMDRVRANGEHLLVLINEILDLSKVEAGRAEVNLSRVDLKALVRETVAQLKGQVGERPVRLRAVLPKEASLLETDAVKLRQVLINLVSNALKFTDEGHVTVRLRVNPQTRQPVLLSVSDSGVGIPKNRLESIFEAFRQGESGPSKRYRGTGLGLSISRSLCELMGYTLEVESDEGVGSRFTVGLASGEALLTAGGEEEETLDSGDVEVLEDTREFEMLRTRLADKTALIIDDTSDARILLTGLIEDLGFQASAAGSGQEGLEMAARHRPDVIFLDLRMPGMDGWEVLANLKREPALRSIPVVVVSIEAEECRGAILGSLDVLRKPVSAAQIDAVVASACPKRPQHTLLVEDSRDDQLIMGRFFERLGLRFEVAETGAEALRSMMRRRPDLLIVDLVLPEMDGVSFLREVRSNPRYHGLPVVVVTARDLSSSESLLLEQGIAAMVQKREDLAVELRTCVENIFFPGISPPVA